ncbi:c-type cytochrome [Roseovarius arcticus]|uniref:c-type cytochrome n=1 Tax=Roseovarius arcticus TaxID=2547404 RepID=UPI001110ADBE|nr:c-type cytochrome [Roseovarius arcticus]
MRLILNFITPITLAAALLPTTGSAEPTIRLLADSCAACHGTDGNSPGSIDELDDIKREEFVEEMNEFKYEQGKGRIMGPIARGITDAQIQALADYFQTLNR